MKKPVVGLVAAVVAQVVFGLGTGDYVQRGLVAHWDAVDNVGTGTHDPATAVWKDVSGNGFDWHLNDGTYDWTEKGLKFLGISRVGEFQGPTKTNLWGKLTTIECVYACSENKDGFILSTGFGVSDAGGGNSSACLVWMKAVTKLGVYTPQSGTRWGFAAAVGETNAYRVTYNRTGYKPFAVDGLALNGQTYTSPDIGDYYGSGTVAPALGGRFYPNQPNNQVPPKGTLLALRIYDRPLTETEAALNYALDRIRLFGDDPEQVALPAGYRWAADGSVEKMAYRWTGNGGDGNWTTAANWGFEDGRSALLAPGEDDEAVIGSAAVSLPAGKTGALAKLTLGEGASLNVAADGELKVRRIYAGNAVVLFGVHTAANATWLGGEGRVTVGDYAALSQQYVRGGLVAQWDAIDNTGAGKHEVKSAVRWIDASGNGYDWELIGGYQWDDDALRMLGDFLVGKMPGKTNADFQDRLTTLEMVWASDTNKSSIVFTPGFNMTSFVLTLDKPDNWVGFYCPQSDSATRYGVTAAIGTTNIYQTVYTRTGAKPTGVDRMYVNGAETANVQGLDYWGDGTSPLLGGRISAYGALPAHGRLLALRIYDRELTKDEAAVNYALDRVRYFGEDPAAALPGGYAFDAAGKVVRLPFEWTGAAGNGEWTDPGNWTDVEGRAVSAVPGSTDQASVPAGVTLNLPGRKISAGELTLGADVTVNVAEDGFFSVKRLSRNGVLVPFGHHSETTDDWISGGGKVCVRGNIDEAGGYAQEGLAMHWDALNNTGLGVQDSLSTVWKDLTGNGFDWQLDPTLVKWSPKGLDFLGLNGVAGRFEGKTGKDLWNKLTTVEFVYSCWQNKDSFIFAMGLNEGSVTRFASLVWMKQGDGQLGVYVPQNGTRWGFGVSAGPTNAYRVVYARAAELPTGVKSLMLNGEAYASPQMNDWWGSGTEPVLGGRQNTSAYMPAKGTLLAMRIYDRELTADEIAINDALDRVRLYDMDPATAGLPVGYVFDDEGNVVRVAYVWTGAAGNGNLDDLGNWSLADGRTPVRLPGEDSTIDLSAAGAVVASRAFSAVTFGKIILGANTVIGISAGDKLFVRSVERNGMAVAAACYSGESPRGTKADWTSGAGVVAVSGGSDEFPELPPVREGNVLVFDVPAGGDETWSGTISPDIERVVKTGAGVQRLAGASGSYAGPVKVEGGTLTAASLQAFGDGSAENVVTVAAAASAGADVRDGHLPQRFVVSGAGVDGNGALVPEGISDSGAFAHVVLGADATVGCAAAAKGGIGGGVLDLQGHTLTVKSAAGGNFLIESELVTNTLATADEKVGEIVQAAGVLTLTDSVFAGGTNNVIRIGGPGLRLVNGGNGYDNPIPWTLRSDDWCDVDFTRPSEGPAMNNHWSGPVDLGKGIEMTNNVADNVCATYSGGFTGCSWLEKAGYGLLTVKDADCAFRGIEILRGGLRLHSVGKNYTVGVSEGGGLSSSASANSFDYFNPGGRMQVFGACYPGMNCATVFRFRGGEAYFGGGSNQTGKMDLGRGMGDLIVTGGKVDLNFITLSFAQRPGYASVSVDGEDATLQTRDYIEQTATNMVSAPFNGYVNIAHGGVYATRCLGFSASSGNGAAKLWVNADGGVLKPLGSGCLGGLKSTSKPYPYPYGYWNEHMTFTVYGGGLVVDTSLATGTKIIEGPLVKPAAGKRLVRVDLPETTVFATNRYTFLRPITVTTSTGRAASVFMNVDDDTLLVTNLTVACPGFGYAETDTVTIPFGGGASGAHTARPVWADEVSAADSKGFTKRGAQDLVLAQANTYLGPTTVEEGMLRFAHAQALPGGSALFVRTGATADLDGNDFTVPTVGGNGTVTNGNLTVTEGIAMTADEFKVRQGLVVKGRVTFAEGAKLTVTDPENIPENGRSHTVLAADEIVGEVSFDTSVLPGNPGDWRFYRSGNAYRLGRNIGITVIVK